MRTETEKLLIVADDFTGANDTGVQFYKYNLRTVVITKTDALKAALDNCDVLVVDIESRYDKPETAYKKTFEMGQIAKANNIKHFYKKLDSTLRGNIGAEISGLMDSLEIKHAIVVPAFPLYGRITKNGNVYVNNILLAETEFAKDPKNPVLVSFIPEIIGQQTNKQIEVVKFTDVLLGQKNLIRKINAHIKNGVQIIVIDVLKKDDLELIGAAVSAINEKVLLVGSTGFAEVLPKHFNIKKEKKSSIVIAGSTSEITQKQINFADKNLELTIIDVEVEKLFSGEKHLEKNRITAAIKESAERREDIIVRTAPTKEKLEKDLEIGLEHGFSGFKVSDIVASFLGEISGFVVQEVEIKGILFTGGDTAIKSTQCLNVTGTVIKDEIIPGIPCGYFLEKQFENILIATKAGGFGNEDAIFRVLNYFKNS